MAIRSLRVESMSKVQLPVVITPTRAELGARCHRRHFLSDILGRARYASSSLEFGSVVHAGIAAHWLKQDVSKVLADEWNKRFEILQTGYTELPSQDKVSLAMANAMLDHYASNAPLAGPFEGQGNFKLVDAEQRFEIPLRDVKLSFQCDRIVYDKEQNWMVIIDSKTGARLDQRWDKQWETSLQMKLYRAGAKTVFDTAGRVDIVVEGVLKHVPSSVRYYVCPEWSDGMLAEAGHNAYVIAALDSDLISQGSDVINLTDADGVASQKLVPNVQKIEELAVRFTPVNYADCFAYGIECPFRRLCVADIDQRIPILHAEYFEIQEESY